MRVSLSDVYTIWLREMKRIVRSRTRLISSMAQPILWLVLFGTVFDQMFTGGVGAGAGALAGAPTVNFKSFFAPGIVAMTVLFSSIFSGIGVIFDREFGFLKEILVAPVSRTSIVLGKAFGGSTIAITQGLAILGLSTLIGARFSPDVHLAIAIVAAALAVFLVSFGYVNMGIAFASRIQNMEGFQMVMNFLVMPMFFLSGAFYPIDAMPGWLQFGTYANPLFYGVDALRNAFNGSEIAALPLWLDLTVLIAFTAAMTAVGVYLFRKAE